MPWARRPLAALLGRLTGGIIFLPPRMPLPLPDPEWWKNLFLLSFDNRASSRPSSGCSIITGVVSPLSPSLVHKGMQELVQEPPTSSLACVCSLSASSRAGSQHCRPRSDTIKPSSHVFTFDVSKGRLFSLCPEWGWGEGPGELGGLTPWWKGALKLEAHSSLCSLFLQPCGPPTV